MKSSCVSCMLLSKKSAHSLRRSVACRKQSLSLPVARASFGWSVQKWKVYSECVHIF
jgi:hypothetical protein